MNDLGIDFMCWPGLWIWTPRARLGFHVPLGSPKGGCNPLPKIPRLYGSSGNFRGHTTYCGVPMVLHGSERGSHGAAGGGAVSSLRRAELSPVSGEPPWLRRVQRLSRRRTLPGATFIYETFILTMATSIRWERNPDSKP